MGRFAALYQSPTLVHAAKRVPRSEFLPSRVDPRVSGRMVNVYNLRRRRSALGRARRYPARTSLHVGCPSRLTDVYGLRVNPRSLNIFWAVGSAPAAGARALT